MLYHLDTAFKPPSCLVNLSGDYQSDEESFHFFRQRANNQLDTTIESMVEETHRIPNSLCGAPIASMVYIDDYNAIEKLRITGAEAHISTKKTEVKILARKTEHLFNTVTELATETGMRVNAKKTQLLCIHANKGSNINNRANNDCQDQYLYHE